MQPIRIFDKDVNLIAEIDNYESFEFQRKLYTAGNFTLIVYDGVNYVDEFQKNRIITIGNSTNKVGIIKSIRYEQQGNSKKFIIQGYELKGILKQRITIPDAGQSHISFTTDPAETILKTLMQKNQDIASMAFDNLSVVTNAATGTTGTTKSRYQNLADEMERIGRAKEMGHIIQLNYTTQELEFDIITVVDKTSSSLNPIIFSEKYNNILNQTYENNDFNIQNYAYIAGQGSGAARTIENAGILGTNFDLYVLFVDARDINDSASLISRGNEAIANRNTTINFTCEVLQTKPFVYETDWNLGTKCTIIFDRLSLNYDKIIEEVTEFYTSTGRTIKAVFGTPSKNIKKYIDINTNNIGVD